MLAVAGGFDATSRGPYSFWTSWPAVVAYCMFGLAVAAIVCAIRDIPIPPPLGSRGRESLTHATPVPEAEQSALPGAPAAITGRWKNMVGHTSSDLKNMQNNSMQYPAYTSRSTQDRPPASLRIGISLACGPLSDSPPTSALRKAFLRLLGSPPVMDLIEQLTSVAGTTWRSWDERPRLSFSAVLATSDEQETPAAWARLLLPQAGTSSLGCDDKRANLILHIEPSGGRPSDTFPATVRAWHRRFTQALTVPAAMAGFLADDLDLHIHSEPAAEIAVWLTAHGSTLAELVDICSFTVIPGTQARWFTGIAHADLQGQDDSSMARAWISEMCDGMNLDGYETVVGLLGQ
jgi:hypothetical protein